MTKLTQKKLKLLWSDAYDFEKLKDKLTSSTVLTPPEGRNGFVPEGRNGFVVYSDASHVGLSFVLMQHDKVVAYDSRQWKVHEKKYPT